MTIAASVRRTQVWGAPGPPQVRWALALTGTEHWRLSGVTSWNCRLCRKMIGVWFLNAWETKNYRGNREWERERETQFEMKVYQKEESLSTCLFTRGRHRGSLGFDLTKGLCWIPFPYTTHAHTPVGQEWYPLSHCSTWRLSRKWSRFLVRFLTWINMNFH